MKLLKARKGFTLIELLIVITIIGVLAVALVPRIVGAPAKARDAARKADLQQIATGIELYADSVGSYPSEGAGKCVSDIDLTGYLTSVPEDPQENASTQCSGGYTYAQTLDGFFLTAALETAEVDSSSENIFGAVSASSGSDTSDQLPSATCNGGTSPCYYYVLR